MSRRPRPTFLALETLDDRIVPAVLDLTARGATSEVAGGIVQQLTQTGRRDVSDSFVRLNERGVEQGYNTNARPLQFDEAQGRQVTRAITVGQVPSRTVDGVKYREFLLNIDQNDRRSELSVDEVKIFVGGGPALTGYADGKLAGLDPVYDLDAGGDVSVLLDARLARRPEADDMVLLVPEAVFVGATADTNVYLYSKLGGVVGAGANNGFEEWALNPDGGGAPEVPAAASLSGTVFFDGDQSGAYEVGEEGLALVELQLTWVDADGTQQTRTTTTDANGNYRFDDLAPGTYSLRQIQPEGYATSGNQIGTAGGQFAGDFDLVTDISLAAGTAATGYNFGEFLNQE